MACGFLAEKGDCPIGGQPPKCLGITVSNQRKGGTFCHQHGVLHQANHDILLAAPGITDCRQQILSWNNPAGVVNPVDPVKAGPSCFAEPPGSPFQVIYDQRSYMTDICAGCHRQAVSFSSRLLLHINTINPKCEGQEAGMGFALLEWEINCPGMEKLHERSQRELSLPLIAELMPGKPCGRRQ